MKYSELTQFEPIEAHLRLREVDRPEEARRMVASYLISDEMAELLTSLVVSRLRLGPPGDPPGVLLVGGPGAGKSHLLAMLSAVAEREELAKLLTHPRAAEAAASLAGKFKVVRLEAGSGWNRLRDSVVAQINASLAGWGVLYRFPAGDRASDDKACLAEMMSEFHRLFPEHGLLLAVDEWPSDDQGPIGPITARDRVFLENLLDACQHHKIRLLAGYRDLGWGHGTTSAGAVAQDQFVQVPIPKGDLRLLVANRLLRKTPEQEALIRGYLTPFARFYGNMKDRMDDFVALFPIHPDYLNVLAKVAYAQPRDVVKALSKEVKKCLHETVPANRPGLIAYDSYWDTLKGDPALLAVHEVEAVREYNELIRGQIEPHFTRGDLREMALRLVHALSVYRLTTGDVYSRHGPTPAELRDTLCLFLPGVEEMGGEPDIDLLLHVVGTLDVLVSKTVRGQFISYHPGNDHYFLHLRRFKRFVKPELTLHWVNAIPFLLLLFSGGALALSRVLNLDHAWSNLIIAVHKVCAASWLILVPLTVLMRPRIHWQHIRPMLQWGPDDALWMVQSMRSLIDRKAEVPPAGRFNTGQKMNACLVMMYFLGFGVTGTVMVWKGPILLPWYVHTCLFVAALGSVGGHLYLALLNPSTRIALAGIFHGWAPMKYVEHHHSLSLPPSRRSHAAHRPARLHLQAIAEKLAAHRTMIVFIALIAIVGGGALIVFHRATVISMNRLLTRYLSSSITPRVLSPKHSQGATGESCLACHAYAGGVPNSKCGRCHEEITRRQVSRLGYHGTLEGDCVRCHKEHPARGQSIVPLDKEKFDHNLAAFRRDGKHAQVACDDCHLKKRPAGAPGIYYLGLKHDACTDCHRDQHAGQLTGACERCHSPAGWPGEALRFKHDTDSSFPLVGRHQPVACGKCHNPDKKPGSLRSAVFKGLPNKCSGCHEEPHRKQFAAECNSCHSSAGWGREHLAFDHSRDAKFPLLDKHAAAACEKCHTPAKPGDHLGFAQFRGLKSDCADCHQEPHRGQFEQACTRCHVAPSAWSVQKLRFNHDHDTKFPLVGKHVGVDCAKCHTPAKPGNRLGFAQFRGLKSECADCHKDPHRGQFERACVRCHEPSAPWSDAKRRIAHDRDTRFPLSGKHASVDCLQCHKPPTREGSLASASFKGLGTGCEVCHKVQHPAAYGSSCTSCHTPAAWPKKNPGFEHIFRIKVAGENLSGRHLTAPCQACHDGVRIGSLDPPRRVDYQCLTCHQKTDPHQGALGGECYRCHSVEGWKGGDLRFDHSTMASFSLDQSHRSVPCAKCHENGRWKPLDARCESCHSKRFLEKWK